MAVVAKRMKMLAGVVSSLSLCVGAQHRKGLLRKECRRCARVPSGKRSEPMSCFLDPVTGNACAERLDGRSRPAA